MKISAFPFIKSCLITLIMIGMIMMLFTSGCIEKRSSLQVRVLDAFSASPISNAHVIIAETGDEFITHEKGFTEEFSVRVYDYEGHLPLSQNWGELTLIVYADGYLDLVLFHLTVYPNKLRNVTLYLFPDDGSTDHAPISIIESPNDEWVKKLVDECK
ncbi:MAG: hypothetical protein IJA35_01805 [Clostridia bacterium]|nr:hypothetical protein [Clostridia bacterium]